MKVILMRHARVLVEWKKHYDSRGYDGENARYDRAPIQIMPPIDIGIRKVYISSLPRSAATAAFLSGEKEIEETKLLDEVPIRSFKDSERHLPVWWWNIMATIQWHWGSPRQRESRAGTDRRIDEFLDMIEAAGEDCLVIGHGIQFYEMMKLMKKRGYVGKIKKYLRNGETREFQTNRGKAADKAPTRVGGDKPGEVTTEYLSIERERQ